MTTHTSTHGKTDSVTFNSDERASLQLVHSGNRVHAKTGIRPQVNSTDHFRLMEWEVTPGRTIAVLSPTSSSSDSSAIEEWVRWMEQLAARDELKALIFTCHGGRFLFSSSHLQGEWREFFESGLELMERMNKPLIAAVDGMVSGIGCAVALCTHAVVASESAQFILPAGTGVIQRLVRIAHLQKGTDGLVQAINWLCSNRAMTAREAEETGWIDQCCEGEALPLAVAWAKAAATAGQGPLAEAFVRRRAWRNDWERPRPFVLPDRKEWERITAGTSDQDTRPKEILSLIQTGYEQGFSAGLDHERKWWAAQTQRLEVDQFSHGSHTVRSLTQEEEEQWIREGQLLPPDSPFYPGISPVPSWQYRTTDPVTVIPVRRPGPREVLVYVLARGANFSGLVVETGRVVREEKAIHAGDAVVVIPSGLQETEGRFVTVGAEQVFPKPSNLSFAEAADLLPWMTAHRITRHRAGGRVWIDGLEESAALACFTLVQHDEGKVTVMTSSDRERRMTEEWKAEALDQRHLRYRGVFTKIPADSSAWRRWEEMGKKVIEDFQRRNRGELADWSATFYGERTFGRAYQLLKDGGLLVVAGAREGEQLTFIGKRGESSPSTLLEQPGESVVLFYGMGQRGDEVMDPFGWRVIQVAERRQDHLVIVTQSEAQKRWLQGRLGEHVAGIISIEECAASWPGEFDWPPSVPYLPNPSEQKKDWLLTRQLFERRTIRPLRTVIGECIRTMHNPEGYADVVVDRADHDALGISLHLVKPKTGRVVFGENMAGKRYSFYASTMMESERRIVTPSATIVGCGLPEPEDVQRVLEWIENGVFRKERRFVMAETEHRGRVTTALGDLLTVDQLYEAWSSRC
ncbi:enoyl-CoA hydratase-related protein [Polycladomyces subterraneus]|uniref:Enoyl-CoA hydratase-related protein n=1 Tax=Polycladomyces subterraneus TaxID=1016997 RepID=A0ABT8IQQ4_9BACL|nr:enoyl-CoA hydratase-related protein [Polycladomyces subterraneus]MDN4595140.1 enoyl-CoA hydratase-related protein [Polycladomyces subterraneus]